MRGRFSSLTKPADVSLSGCCSLSAYTSLSETPAIVTFLFFIFSHETEVENTLIHNDGKTKQKNLKGNKWYSQILYELWQLLRFTYNNKENAGVK